MILTQCTANKPLLLVIPPEGITIPCPIHEKGHFVKGSSMLLVEDGKQPSWRELLPMGEDPRPHKELVHDPNKPVTHAIPQADGYSGPASWLEE